MTMNDSPGCAGWVRERWMLWVTVAFGLTAGVSVWCLRGEAGPVAAFQAGVLTATLVAVYLYTAETRRLRLDQRAESELRQHPWLDLSGVRVEKEPQGRGVLGSYVFWCPVKNVGPTPAFEIKHMVKWRATGNEVHEEIGEGSVACLVPGQTIEIAIPTDIDEPAQHRVELVLQYRTAFGGGGILMTAYEVLGRHKARVLASDYTWWSSHQEPPSKADPAFSLKGHEAGE